MPLPKPKKGEHKNNFMRRCLTSNIMKSEYVNINRRFRICSEQWGKK